MKQSHDAAGNVVSASAHVAAITAGSIGLGAVEDEDDVHEQDKQHKLTKEQEEEIKRARVELDKMLEVLGAAYDDNKFKPGHKLLNTQSGKQILEVIERLETMEGHSKLAQARVQRIRTFAIEASTRESTSEHRVASVGLGNPLDIIGSVGNPLDVLQFDARAQRTRTPKRNLYAHIQPNPHPLIVVTPFSHDAGDEVEVAREDRTEGI